MIDMKSINVYFFYTIRKVMHDVVYFLHAKNSWILQQKLTKKEKNSKNYNKLNDKIRTLCG